MADAMGYRIWLLFLFLVATKCAAQQTTTSTSSNLTADAFNVSTELCRISGSASVLVNSTLYVDGGDVTVQSCDSGQTSNCSTWADTNNYFFAISFEKSLSSVNWSSLSYQAIKKPKTVPLTSRGILWRNKEGNEFYKFGGAITGNTSSVNYYTDTVAPTSKIWKFADLSAWSALSPALSTNWDLQYTSVPSLDKSFAFGSWSADNVISSMMVLDSSKSPEASTRLTGFDPAGVYEKGAMLHLPVQGGDGVLLFIGGSVTPATGAVPGTPDVPMSTVRLYDIANGTWYNQSTSTDTPGGIFPNPRHNFCAVLASTGPETFDIFMYGGDFNTVEDESYATGLWILSIPSFKWFYFEDPDNRTRLSGLTCQVIGPHFIRFGGWNYYGPSVASGPTCMNAVSIFNLNSFTWTDTFDPTETTYTSPTKVAAWNSQNAYPISGWNEGVQALFASTNSTTSPTTSATPTSSSTSKAPKIIPKVLGSVLGGLLIIVLLLIGALFLIKRKKQRLELKRRFEAAGEYHKPPAVVAEMSAERIVAELPATPDLLVGPPIELKGKKPGGAYV